MELVRLIEQEKRIINVDETWINESNFVRKVWGRKDGRGNARLSSVTPRISMIAALDIDGKVWYCLSHATTDSDCIRVFLRHLIQKLDQQYPGWQDNTIILWDNAPYHTSAETMSYLRRQGIQVVYSGPYSYSAAPIETLFGHLKLGELNHECVSTGKR